MTRGKSTCLMVAFLAAGCGGSAYRVNRTGGNSAGGSVGVGGGGGGAGGDVTGGGGGSGGAGASATGSSGGDTGGAVGTAGTTSGNTGGAGDSGGAAGATATDGGTGGAGGAIATGGNFTSGGTAGTAAGGAATGGAGTAGAGGASAGGGVTGSGGGTGGTGANGGASGRGGTAGGLEPCSSSDGSGCADPAFCLDTRSDTCSPDYMTGCTGLCTGRRRAPICAGLPQTTPCADGFTCLPDARTALGTDPVSVCVGSDTRECKVKDDCPTGFSCVPSAGGSRCSPDLTVCEDFVTCKIAQPPRCPPGYARSTPDACYGPCVPVEFCSCSTDTQCGFAGAFCDRKQGRCSLAQSPEPRCQLPFDVGPCDAAVRVYAFIDGECKSATYGGCGGNDNRFPTLEECLARCQGMPGDQPCPDGRTERPICLGCGAAGGCIRYASACAKPCATQADCLSTGLSCSGGYCETMFCL
jgi:hypothetical protein